MTDQTIQPGKYVALTYVIEDEHGQVVVRDRNGVRVATYWFVE